MNAGTENVVESGALGTERTTRNSWGVVMQKEESEKIKCTQCQRKFIDDASLTAHVTKAHPSLNGRDFEDKFAKLRDRSIEIIWDFLNSDGANTGLRNREQSARQVLSNWTRNEATKSNREQTNLLTARSLAQNPEQLAEYVRLTMPHSPILKALPSKSDGDKPS